MISIVKQTINFYLKNNKAPSVGGLEIDDMSLLEKKASIFVTIYEKGEVRGSAGNIKEVEENAVLELINSTISAISTDSRFKPITPKIAPNLKIRVDIINGRKILKEGDINEIDPLKMGVIAIKKDYSKACTILPNISPLLLKGSDFKKALNYKLSESFDEKKYVIYAIETVSENDF